MINGVVYKLCCDDVKEFYIGSSENFIERKRRHKSNCNNPNSTEYNYKVYKYIRENGGYENWKYETIEEKEFENKNVLKIREQHYIDLFKPSLNMVNAIENEEQRKQKQNQYDQKQRAIKINCPCGGKTDKRNKPSHEKTNIHTKYLQTINNITNNITNITINN